MNSSKVDVAFTNDKGSRGRSAPVAVANLISAAVALSVTRPTNATPYLAKAMLGAPDSVTPANAGSAILKFANIGNKGGIVKIVGLDLMIHAAALPAGMAGHTLHLYDAEPEAKLDGAVWDLPAGDRAKYLGSVAIAVPVDVGSTLYVQNDALAKQVKLADNSNDLWAVLATDAGYTPVASTLYQIRLQVENKV